MKRDFQQLKRSRFDLLVIGGGITGAWVAYDAALRGLSVAIIDKGDWSSGTSMASSKLIHGGLRYLESYEFGLVKKSLQERKLLAEMAPHRVWPLDFLVPLYKSSRVKPFKLKLGLLFYDWLAGRGQPVDGHKKYSLKEMKEQFPFIQDEAALCSFQYGDCQTDDARFTLEIIAGAIEAGAVAVNYAEARSLIIKNGRVLGARVRDLEEHEEIELRARATVNATGVWGAFVPGTPEKTKKLYRMSKGVHVVLPALPTHKALLLTAKSDGRVFFVIPWYGRTLLGTTDTYYEGDPDEVKVEEQDIEYLISEANHALKDVQWTKADVIGSLVGIRMLAKSNSNHPSAVSREWSQKQTLPGLIQPIGGKYTSAREDASKLVDRALSLLKIPAMTCQTARSFPWAVEGDFQAWIKTITEEGSALGLDALQCKSLAHRYGKKAQMILNDIREDKHLAERLDPELPFCEAEVKHAKEHEMARNEEDLFRRRIPLRLLSKSYLM